MTATSIPIAEITVPSGRRTLRHLDELVASIADLGVLINPITVTDDRRLVAGYHRLEACKRLGWDTIPATVVTGDALWAELVEIDENIRRNDPTVLERADLLKRRKDIHEALHPETKQHVVAGRASSRARWGDGVTTAESAVVTHPKTFTADAATQTGKAERTIREDVQIATNIAPAVKDRIRDTPLADRKSDLLTLAKAPAPEQATMVDAVLSGEARSIDEAKRQQRRAVAVAEQATNNGIRLLAGDRDGRVARSDLIEAFDRAKKQALNNLLLLKTDAVASALDADGAEKARRFVRRCREWLDEFERDLNVGWRVVGREDS